MRVVVKGAPEKILPMCTQMLDSHATPQYLGEDMRKIILDKYIIDDFAGASGFRTFAYAYKDINSDYWEGLQRDYNNFTVEADREIVETDLIFVAGFGIEDSLREKVGVSVLSLKQQGVTVRMISGDNIMTATRAAVQSGIINEG